MSKAHSRQKSFQDFRVGKFLRNSSLWLNIKRPGRCAPWGEQGGGYCVWLLVKIEEQHGTVIPSDSHSGFYFPPFAKANGFETMDCLESLPILDILYMAGGRNNKGLLLRDTSHLFLKFIEFPYNWYPGPY